MSAGTILKRLGAPDQRSGIDDQGNIVLRGSRFYYGSDGGLKTTGFADMAVLGPATSPVFPVAAYGAKGDNVTDDTAAIQAAITAAFNHGGGKVLLDALTYFAVGPINKLPGVFIEGQGPNTSLDGAYSRAGGTWMRGNGTADCFVYNNTPILLGANGVVTQLTTLQVEQQGLRDSGVANIGFDGYKRAIHVGDLGNPGCFEGCIYRNLIAINCTEWGFYFENSILAEYDFLRVYKMAIGALGTIGHPVSCTNYNFGNCSHNLELAGTNFGGPNLPNTRGILFQARAGAIHNQICGRYLQSANGGGLVASAATTVNGNTAIAITPGQGVNFGLDKPVIFSTSNVTPTQATGWGGFPVTTASSTQLGLCSFFVVPFMLAANLAANANAFNLANAWSGVTGTYAVTFYLADGTTVTQNIVLTNGTSAYGAGAGFAPIAKAAWKQVTIAGTGGTNDYIQVSSKQRGAPLPAGQSATNFICHFGYPLIEISGYAHNTDPYWTGGIDGLIQGCEIDGIDLEGTATTYLLAQNGNVTLRTNFLGGNGPQSTSYASHICIRGGLGSFGSNQGISIDADNQYVQAVGVALGSTVNIATRLIQATPVGIFTDQTPGGPTTFNIGQGRQNTPVSFQAQSFTGGANFVDGLYPVSQLAQHTKTINFVWAGFTFDGQYFGSNVYSPAGTGNLTNPDTGTLQTLDGTAGGSAIGSQAGFPFEFANSSTNALLLSVGAGQNWNGVTNWTQVKILPGGTFSARAQYNQTGNNGFWEVLSGDHIPYYTLNAANVIACGATPRWVKVGTVTFGTFSTAGLTNTVAIFTLPPGGVIEAVTINPTTAFSGGAIGSYTISVGNAGNHVKYTPAQNVFTGAGYTDSFLPGSESMTNGGGTQIVATATSTGANLNAATAGSADIYVKVSARI